MQNLVAWVWFISVCVWIIGLMGWPYPIYASSLSPTIAVNTPALVRDGLQQRLQEFPNWQSLPKTSIAKGDLFYPDWFAGEWEVKTTLVDLAAPFAPEIVTPGFAANQQALQQPVTFVARFVPENTIRTGTIFSPASTKLVADRVFNGLNLAEATLTGTGKTHKSPILTIKIDPQNPNRQIALLRQEGQIVSTITGRRVETPRENQFLTTEIFQQEFRGLPQIYFNVVENTTAYTRQSGTNPSIIADQVTAIYLSPQDPKYFLTRDRPVALYRYYMEFNPIKSR